MHITVVGLGKLGSPLAAVLASKGHTVIGVDLNAYFVDAINAGRAPVVEPRLQKLLDASKGRLRATKDYADAIPHTDISFIIVPTPSDQTGRFSNRYVLDAVEAIGKALRGTDRYHVVNITSTVMPGSTGGEIRAALEKASGRTVGENLGLTYNPEFIALGSVVRNMLYPDMILIGESDARAGDTLEAVYKTSTENSPPFQRMNLVNAEITKISVNTYVTMKISFANMLSGVCEKIAGADVAVVTEALGKDTRIGGKYLQGALGYGGPCFPRDNVAFSKLARDNGARADLAEATDAINHHQVTRVSELVRANLNGADTVAILGMAYKPDTPVIEESQGVMIARDLAGQGVRVRVFDPLAMDATRAALGDNVRYASTLEEAVEGAALVVIATPSPEYRDIAARLADQPSNPVVIDCWRMAPYAQGGRVVQIGRGA
ncbi:UDP-glucose/GDP-mannose dehydrogenase family protein [soil metagenome]